MGGGQGGVVCSTGTFVYEGRVCFGEGVEAGGGCGVLRVEVWVVEFGEGVELAFCVLVIMFGARDGWVCLPFYVGGGGVWLEVEGFVVVGWCVMVKGKGGCEESFGDGVE